ncbi:MAG: hypothetical protein AAF564_14390 [Bacteroidota bacterium]
MTVQFSSDTFHKYLWLAQKATSRITSLAAFEHLRILLRRDPRNVLALLCHDALFKGDARMGGTQSVSLITGLAMLDRDATQDWLRVQGQEHLRRRLKRLLEEVPTLEEKLEAEVDVRLIVGYREYFVIVTSTPGDELYGVVRLAVVG